MAYLADYEPKGSSYPNGRVVRERHADLVLEDPTPDGGIQLEGASAHFSGRRVREESVPRETLWLSRSNLQDFEAINFYSVSNRLRDLIEEIEPGVHQFVPIRFVNKSREVLEERFFWQICRRLDCIWGNRPGWVLNGPTWKYPREEWPIFSSEKIGSAKFWQEKHFNPSMMFADEVMERLNENDMSGFRLTFREER